MKKLILIIFIAAFLGGCSPFAPSVVENIDPGGFYSLIEGRVVYNAYPFSFVLPEGWSAENFTGEKLDENTVKTVVVRDALDSGGNAPVLTISFHKVPQDFDPGYYSMVLQRQHIKQNTKYFSKIEEKSVADDRMGIKNSIFYITSGEDNGVAQIFYVLHTTKFQTGVEIILEADSATVEEVSSEFYAILGSLNFDETSPAATEGEN